MDDDDQGVHMVSYQFDTSPDSMRQPTNLELATLLPLQSNFQLAQIQLLLLERDYMSDPEDWEAAVSVFNLASRALVLWWNNLLYEPADFSFFNDDDEEEEDD